MVSLALGLFRLMPALLSNVWAMRRERAPSPDVRSDVAHVRRNATRARRSFKHFSVAAKNEWQGPASGDPNATARHLTR
jgi:hypothetical protein